MKQIIISALGALLVVGCQSNKQTALTPQDEFAKLWSGQAVEKVGGGMRFLEGPQWAPAEGGYLIFSDIPANELKRWDANGGIRTYRKPSAMINGNTLDNNGNLVSAEHGNRRVSRTLKNGTIETVVDSYAGKKFNSPNDVVVKRDGSVWFTDPDYGLAGRPKEQQGNYVYRYDPKSRKVEPVVMDFDKPNGLCFSPDETKLYIADSGRPRHIRVFDVDKKGRLSNGKIFCSINPGGPDGIRCDSKGRIWSSAGDGVHIFRPDGTMIGKIPVPETPANLCFGGKGMKTLFITARTGLYRVDVGAKGLK